jgi:YD repeat-containing protein
LLANVFFGHAQTTISVATTAASTAGQIIPPAPKTASLGTFGQLPVELNTGAVSVSVPLLDVHSGALHLPVALSFNTTGSKVSEATSWVGQGWNLSSGGVITRTVCGQPDETPGTGYQTVWPIWRHVDSLAAANFPGAEKRRKNLEWRANALNWDLEADTYTISAPGLSAVFAVDAYGRVHLSPANGWVLFGRPSAIGGWELAAPDGTHYQFDAPEMSMTEDASGNQYEFASAWHLTAIESLDGRNRISLSYSSDGLAAYVPLTQVYQVKFTPYGVRVKDSPGVEECEKCFRDPPSTGLIGQNSQAVTMVRVTTVSLREIRSATQRVVFHSDSLLQSGNSGPFLTEPPGRLLRRIMVSPLTNATSQTRTFRFTYLGDKPSQAPDNALRTRHFLAAVQEVGLPPTQFEYYNPALPDRHACAQDHWGYYNGATNTTLVPQLPRAWRYLLPGGAKRTTNPTFLLNGALQRITYPTGGSTTFWYEANQVLAPFFFDIDEPTLGERRLGFQVSVSGNPVSDSLSQHVFDLLYGDPTSATIPPGASTPFVNAVVLDLPAGARALDWQPFEKSFSATYVPRADMRLVKLDTTSADPVADALAFFPKKSEPYYWSADGKSPVDLPPGRYLLMVAAFDASYRADLALNLIPSQSRPSGSLVTRTVGGLRVRRLADVAGAAADSVITTYDYTTRDPNTGKTLTTGILFDIPTYIQSTPCGAVVVSARDNSLLPKNGQGAYHLGYKQVTTTRHSVTASGTTVTTFLNVPDPSYGKLVTGETISTGSGQVVQEIQNEYEIPDGSIEEVRSNHLSTFGYEQYKSIGSEGCGWITKDTLFNSIAHSFGTGQMVLARTVKRRYEGANQGKKFQEVTTLNRYVPDAVGRYRPQPSEVATVRASGDTLLVWRRYAADFDTTGTAASGDPVARGIAGLLARSATAALVEERTGYGRAAGRSWVNGTLTEYATQHPRRSWAAETTSPKAITGGSFSQIVGGHWQRPAPYQCVQEFDAYSAQGQLLQTHTPTGLPISFLWGNDQLIAQASNLPYGSGAYTSFEESATGHWQYDSLGRHSVTTHLTGRVGYQLDGTAGAAIRCAKLPAGAYELWVWIHGPSVPQITGAIVQHDELVTTAGAWYQHRFRLTLPVNATLRLNSAPNQLIQLDELRLHAVGARMTSYTHDWLAGPTSQTDPTGRTTTYEYDGLGRLVRTRDEQGRILFQQQYHYAGAK